MKIFLDTANIKEINEALSTGILDGVTTNPTLLAKEGKDPKVTLSEILSKVDGYVSVEVISEKFPEMVEEAREIAALSKNVVVKIPMTKDGIKATNTLSKEGIKVNVTLVFSPLQALLAAKAGAFFVSPFVGRLDDISHVGMDIVQSIRTIFDNYDFSTQILVASIRHPIHVLESALLGADIATMPYTVFEKLFVHPLTDIGIERFLKDYEKIKKV